MNPKKPNRTMVLIADDAGFGSERRDTQGPKSEFVEIAHVTKARIESFTSARARYGAWYSALFRKRPAIGAAVHAACIAGDFDAIYATGEDLSLPLAALLLLRRWPGRLICVFHNLTPRKRLLLRLIGGRRFHRVITVSERQRTLLIREGCIDPDRVVNVRNWVDTDFFRPDPLIPAGDYVIACGAENRDYATLADAAKLTPRRIKVFGHGFFNSASVKIETPPQNFELCPRVSYEALRREYAGAMGVVIPLNAVDYAAGVTGLVEAMAMGKPIIVTQSVGIADYLEASRPGLAVEPANAEALAEAVERLATDPVAFASQGKLNRAWALEHCSLQAYARLIDSFVNDAV